jgi:hypothetical protein
MTESNESSLPLLKVVDEIALIGKLKHSEAILNHAQANLPRIHQSIRNLPVAAESKLRSAIIISAGPSLRRRTTIRRIVESGYAGTIIAVDGSYVACLREGLVPDYVVTLDPHPTRIVRWFGDPEWEDHRRGDTYFERQDLDIEFRENSRRQNQENMQLVNEYGHKSIAIVASSAPPNVVARLTAARMQLFWWHPLVDSPNESGSLTRRLFNIIKLPCLNTGGNVGGASWVFAATVLEIPAIGLTGMDFGYYSDTPKEQTQTYYELMAHLGTDDISDYFVNMKFPLTNEVFYTDPTYFWYRRNFLELVTKSNALTCNCTEGGTLFGAGIQCISLDEFFARQN